MPTDVQVALQGLSGLPHDRYVNTLHFDGDNWTTAQADELWAAYSAFANVAMGGLAAGPHVIKAYAPGPNPGGPYLTKEYDRGAALTDSGPGEVALCLSYAAVDDPEASTPRRRGRIYLGPFAGVMTNKDRPSSVLIDAALDLGEAIAQVGFASNVTWSLYSQLDSSYHKIESIWVDDAWDTQRRRGLDPTERTVRDVQ